MALKFPDSADSADLAAAGYSQVIILGGGTDTVSATATADYLILAGGGGGGGLIAGGGGSGGYRASWGTGADGSGGNSGGLSALETALSLNSGTSYSITVGQGGEGGVGWGGVQNQAYFAGHTGRSTSISGSDITTVTTVGGGGGRGYNYTGGSLHNGGSGGGGANAQSGGTGTSGQGFDGGSVTVDVGGGGGGAAAAGQGSTSAASAGDGGDGLASAITGVSITRAGGGGGGIRQSSGTDNGIGGDGGGGDGGVVGFNSTPPLSYGTVTSDRATHGRSKYGGGGGGAGYNSTGSSLVIGGSGGSGIAIFRLPSTLTYSASQLSSDVSNDSNCTAYYLNTQVYTDDTNFDNVVLLLDGTSTVDKSSAITSLTNNGVAVNQNSQSHPYASGALLFDGTDDLTISTENYNLYLGTDDWTIEGWFRTTNLTGTNTILEYRASGSDNGAGKMFIGVLSNGQAGIYENTVYQAQSSIGSITTNTWYHLAFVRSGGTVYVFVDGSLADSGTLSSSTVNILSPNNRPIIGGYTGGGANWIGEWADFRITKGVARYTSSFTAPTSAFPNRETSTGGDHVITFTVATEDPHDGVATTNDGTATWTPTLNTVTPAASTTWTIPEGVDSFSIMAIGAGGAAGYSDSSFAGGGGGGGGLAYLNNISVVQGNYSVQSITVDGGQLGISNDSTGGDGEDLSVTMNLATSNPSMNLSGYNLNPYGQVYYDSDSDAAGIMFITSTDNDSVQISPFGTFDSVADGGQTLFDVYSNLDHFTIRALAEPNPNATTYDANHPWLANPVTTNYTLNSNFIVRNTDRFSLSPFDSNHYFESDLSTLDDNFGITDADFLPRPPIGTIDSLDSGSGAFTLFRVMSSIDNLTIGTMPGRSPYVDSNGTIVISSTGDPSDFKGFGPDDLNQILLIKNLTP